MEERLQKIIAESGLASRRSAEVMISDGRVTVNGAPAETGMKADKERDAILVDGVPLPVRESFVYLMLNKPRGYLTSVSDDRGRKTVMELLSGVKERVYPVGRLDMDSEGLLLLTNDGELANLLMHPSNEKKKEYRVSVTGRAPDISSLESPIEIDGGETRPAKVRLLKTEGDSSVISVIIHEGRNRQVRRLCERAGLKVKRLKRVSVGPLRLGKLGSGEWRRLTDAEIASLRCRDNCKSASDK